MAPNSRQVFVNCPYDSNFYPMVEAIAFAICVCGYTPRFAGESIDSGQSRLSKIIGLIDECPFSLHDISRTEVTATGLPRFNMPFELGLALGRKYSFERGGAPGVLIFDREPYRYHESISDLSGCDPRAHRDDPLTAIQRIREWLPLSEQGATAAQLRVPLYGPIVLVRWFSRYRDYVQDMKRRLKVDREDLPFADLVTSIRDWLEVNTRMQSED